MKKTIQVLCVLATLALSLASQTCGGGQLVTCDQTKITGTAGTKTYNTAQACVDARPGEQKIAEADGIAKCKAFCAEKGAGCTPQPVPSPPKSTPACKQQTDGTFQSEVKTGEFDCICKK